MKPNKSFYRVIKTNSLFVGDICYALNRDIYDNVWGGMNYADGVIEKDEEVYALVVGTAFGDGNYKSKNGFSFPVDAGVIGVTNMNYLCDEDEFCFGFGRIIEVPSGIAEVELSYKNGDIFVEITDETDGTILYKDCIYTDVYNECE